MSPFAPSKLLSHIFTGINPRKLSAEPPAQYQLHSWPLQHQHPPILHPLASPTQCMALFSFLTSTTIFSAILLEVTCCLSRTPFCAKARKPVQTVKKRTFGSAYHFFSNSMPSKRLDMGLTSGTRIQSTGRGAAYMCVMSENLFWPYSHFLLITGLNDVLGNYLPYKV